MKHFRDELGLEDNPASIQVDAQGLKKLFSHGIRRFCNFHGNVTARESWAMFNEILNEHATT